MSYYMPKERERELRRHYVVIDTAKISFMRRAKDLRFGWKRWNLR